MASRFLLTHKLIKIPRFFKNFICLTDILYITVIIIKSNYYIRVLLKVGSKKSMQLNVINLFR